MIDPNKIAIGAVSALIAVLGWAFSLENRVTTVSTAIETVSARQQERSDRFAHIEELVGTLSKEVMSPSPKPETKVAIEGLRRDIDILQDRLNSLHNYLLLLPIRPAAPIPVKPDKRGDVFNLYPQQQIP